MPQVYFRQIKAKPVNWQAFYNELAQTIDREIKPDLIAWFQKVSKSWKHKQVFKAIKSIKPAGVSIYVYPTGENAKIWRFVTIGNPKEYPIPKPGNTKAKTLKFKWDGKGSYKARTTPQGGYKGPGKSTGKTVLMKHVTHPIVPGRHFERHIARWYRTKFIKTMDNAVARGLRKARA